MSSIGSKLKMIRKQKGLTQEELAKGLVNRSYISQIEKGLVFPSYKTVVSLATRLDQDISIFFEEPEINLLSITDIQKSLKNAQSHLELNDLKKVEEIIKEVKEESLSKLSEFEKGIYYWILGEIHLFKKEWEISKSYLVQSISYLENSENEKDYIKSLNSLAKAYLNSSEIENALEKLNEASNLLIKNQINDTLKVEVLLNMAICHGRLGEFRSAIRLCKEGNYINLMTNNNYKSGQLFMTLGICYKKSKDLTKAKDFYLKAKSFFEIFESKYNEAGTLINLGILCKETKEFDLALDYIKSAETLFKELNDEYQVFNCQIELIKTYISLQMISEAECLSLEIINTIPEKFYYLRKQVYETLSEIYILKKDLKQALLTINRAEELIQKSPDKNLIIKKAQIHMKLGNFKVAAELFDNSISNN